MFTERKPFPPRWQDRPDLSFINNTTTTIDFADSSQNNCFWRLSSLLVYKQGKQAPCIKQHCACANLQAAPPFGRDVRDVDCAQNITCSHRAGQYQLLNRISLSSFRFTSLAYLITDRNTLLHVVRCNDSKIINRAHYAANAITKKKMKSFRVFFFFSPKAASKAQSLKKKIKINKTKRTVEPRTRTIGVLGFPPEIDTAPWTPKKTDNKKIIKINVTPLEKFGSSWRVSRAFGVLIHSQVTNRGLLAGSF